MKHTIKSTDILRLLLLLMTLMLSSCGRIQNPQFTGEGEGENIPADVTLEVELAAQEALQMGQAAEVEILLEQNGLPVEGAAIEIEGNMTHAGMEPMLVKAEESAPGQYHATLDWTMGGGWLVTVRATLPDGQTAERVIENLQVDSQ